LHRGPYGKYKSNISEEVLLSTIHMSHNFAERTFPFLEFKHEVLHAGKTEEAAGESPVPAGEGSSTAADGRRSIRGSTRIH